MRIMHNDLRYRENIETYLIQRAHAVQVDTKGNLMNLAVLSEDFYTEFLNILLDLNLTNANALERNKKGIDLIDLENRVVVQVSATYAPNTIRSKIKKSIDNFEPPEQGEWQFYFVPITDKAPEIKSDLALPDGVHFDHCRDILDIARIMELAKGIKKLRALSRLVDKYSRKRSKPLLIIGGLLLITILFAIIGGAIARSKSKTIDEKLDVILSMQENLTVRSEISPEKAALLYKTGMESFHGHQYGSAEKQFYEAITEQEGITGADSNEVGIVYLMLGLSRHYGGNSIKDNGNDAISAINCAIQIFKQHKSDLELAWAYNYLGTIYFDNGEKYLNRATEQVKNSISVLDEYLPDALELSEFSFESLDSPPLRFFGDPYDYEAIYRACNYFNLLEENYDLLGKISYNSNDISSAFYYFNLALKTDALSLDADYALATCASSEKIEIENDSIKAYLKDRTPGSILEYKKQVKIYLSDSKTEKINFEQFTNDDVYISSFAASSLTNRGMLELDLGFPEITIDDCLDAIDIWNHFPYTSRTNISFAYRWLALAHLKIAESADSTDEYLEENKDAIEEYLDLAITYDTELFGESHRRTAFSYETKGLVSLAFGEIDIAVQSYQTAKSIYSAWGDEAKAQECQDTIMQIESNN